MAKECNMTKHFQLDLGKAVEMIRWLTPAIDLAWQKAHSTGAPAGIVMALDEASLGLHRALIALNDVV
jgi:hypothetical protein